MSDWGEDKIIEMILGDLNTVLLNVILMEKLRHSLIKTEISSLGEIWRIWGTTFLLVLGILLVVILVFILVTAWRKRSEKYSPREKLDENKVWQGDPLVPQGTPEWKE